MIGIDFLAAITEYISMLFVLAAFFPWRKHNRLLLAIVIVVCGFVHIFLSAFSSAEPLFFRTVLMLAAFCLMIGICFQGNYAKRILIAFLYWACVFAIDFSVLMLFMIISGQTPQEVRAQEASYLFGVICSRSLMLTLSLCCRYVTRREKRNRGFRVNSRLWIVLLLIPLYTIVGMGALINRSVMGEPLPGGSVALGGGLLCVNMLVCFVLNRLEQNQLVAEENRLLQTEAAHNLELARTYQDSFARQRKITHEFRNQLDAIGNLLAQKEYDRAVGYVQHLQNSLLDAAPLIHTNHPIVDAILNQKYQQAARQGIGMLLYCNDLSAIPLEDGDLVTLLGNILINSRNL